MNQATQNESLMTLLLDAPESHVASVQQAMREVAVGNFRDAAKTLGYAADWFDIGHEWADRAGAFAAVLRVKGNA